MAGRPTIYTAELAAKICDFMIQGESLRTICKRPGFPAMSNACVWLHKHPEFKAQYDIAREARTEILFEEILEIADKGSGDAMRDRLRVDTRKWYASKVNPRKFGDKVENVHLGADGGPITYRVETVIVDSGAKPNGAGLPALTHPEPL